MLLYSPKEKPMVAVQAHCCLTAVTPNYKRARHELGNFTEADIKKCTTATKKSAA